MATITAAFLLALALSAAGMPLVRRAAVALDFVDVPAARKVHQTPVPLLGGVGILLGALITVTLLYRGDPPRTVAGFLLATTVVALVGLWDDYRPLPPIFKLLGQVAGVLILVYFGIQVSLPVPEPINLLLTVLWVLGITNAINFLDNMDGLSAGISVVSGSFILLLALLNDQFLVAGLSAALVGACLGFLRYNFPPATIFMGDVGSLFLGFSLAVLALQLRFPANSNFVTWMVPLFLLGLPIYDMTLVVLSRLRRGLSPATAGKDHTSHRLVRLGFSSREAVLILYLISGVLGMMALFITQATLVEGYVLGAIGAALAGLSIFWLERRWKEEIRP